MKFIKIAAIAAAAIASTAAQAQVAITEWMYKGGVGEFIEFTNIGTTAVDFSNWSYDDDSRIAGVFSLAGLGTVAAGESVIITETEADVFRADWGLSLSVKVLGNYTNNLGNGDEVNLYNGTTLVDRLTFGKTLQTSDVSGHATSLAALGANNVSLWVLSSVGDVEGSWRSVVGTIGSPGQTSFAPAVPEPQTYAMMVAGLCVVGAMARRRRG
ncbi:MAG: lamin tail domain-containing protein [Aquabacterium sp.]|uniref:lamin tail domain-containing protein n=1 Tax=Aquabacterium sp. TaxID=1872578 RepID=UPI003BAF9A16